MSDAVDPAATTGSAAQGKVLPVMLDRLFAAIAGGPGLNCRPHSSRQRLDWCTLANLGDLTPASALAELLSDKAATRLVARTRPPPPSALSGAPPSTVSQTREGEAPEARAAREMYSAQQQVLTKLRILVDEARTYEDDTGVHVLNVGFPVLHLPPGVAGRRGSTGRRILAPIAFIPVTLSVQGGSAPAVQVECRSDEIDRVVPNEALLAWIEQQTGTPTPELFNDTEGTDPWKEITALVKHVCTAMDIAVPPAFADCPAPSATTPATAPCAPIELESVPKSDDFASSAGVLRSAVLGLFPASKQGLIRDTKEMIRTGAPSGPIRRFVSASAAFDVPRAATAERNASPVRTLGTAHLVAPADPCQARAVAAARQEDALVIHGPPGTGKSQTITNIIGDSLVRGQRVLFVCEKRTALDVVAHRLEAIGLGDLCAVIHDPQRDQKNLYMSVREQLDRLPDLKTKEGLDRTLEKIDEELARSHAELTEFRSLLSMKDPEGRSLHERIGEVMRLSALLRGSGARVPTIPGVGPDVVESSAADIREVLSRGTEVGYPGNVWRHAAGVTLGAFVALPGQHVRERMENVRRAAGEADARADPRIAPFQAQGSLHEQAAAREALAIELERVLAQPNPAPRRYWASRPQAECVSASNMLSEIEPAIARASEGPLDAELLMTIRAAPPDVVALAKSIGTLESYLASARSILGFLAFGRKKAASSVLTALGLALNVENAERARTFFARVRSLQVVRSSLDSMGETAPAGGVPDRDATLTEAAAVAAVVRLLNRVRHEPRLASMAESVSRVLSQQASDADLLWGLRAAGPRAAALEKLEQCVVASGLIDSKWAGATFSAWRGGEAASPIAERLASGLGTLEGVLRVRESLATIKPALRPHVAALLENGVDQSTGMAALALACTTGSVASMIESHPKLHAADARRVQTLFGRWRELENHRREVVRDIVLARWQGKQRERLVVGTGSRLNGEGAKVRQRLITRGARALRLRQVLALGREVQGGDPILDLRPVWMASPETVAQVFPREAMFDLVIFDEASQCRLEDALPVLTRAQRVVVAGDPKQLPPTRFFESGAATTDEDPIANEDELFEAQQTQVEDLLSAALNLALAESYLDVHYRSRNSDLIEFSNEHFYSHRLQAIPGHPRNRTRVPPVNLRRVDGVYKDRANEREADEVVRVVRDLLKRAEPPSIGIACFNLVQRDLIAERLDQAAGEDPAFGAKLAAARARRSAGAPDGLFVKNLENVQGDERDHIIISTTYGPDAKGKFHRRFGPLLQPGGGRRLNVLVTRARHEVHLVTSIPREQYLSLPEIPLGASPGGGWLLLAYLRFAEELRGSYSAAGTLLDADRTAAPPESQVRSSAAPSGIATELGAMLAREHSTGSIVHWGNDGFCVDVALRHPTRPLDVTCGILCDFARYTPGQDPVEWDIFRTGILESQGWHLERLWSPGVFRDPQGTIERVLAAADRIGREEHKSDAIATTRPTAQPEAKPNTPA